MKAIRVHQHGLPESLPLEPIAELKPAPGEILVKMHAAGVNPVDYYTCAGSNGYSAHMPYTPGRDGAGVIVSINDCNTHLKEGDRVYCAGTRTGSFAQFALCDAEQLYPLSDSCDFVSGACVGIPYGTAYRALFELAKGKPGDIVLIHGASGGVGTAALQLALAQGLCVIATAGSSAGIRLLQEQGAHLVLDHRDPNHLDQIHPWTHRHGADIVLEMLADQNLGGDLKALAYGGRVIVIGSRGNASITPRDLMARDASIQGMSLANLNQNNLQRIHAALGAGLKNGSLKPVIGKRFPLAEASQALAQTMASGAMGNLVITID